MDVVKRRRVLLSITLVAVLGAIVSLLFPWVRVGAANYSTIDLIGAAGALDIISGAVRVAVVFVWFVVPLLGAIALFCLAGARPRSAALACMVIGLLVMAPAVLLITTFTGGVAWGAIVGGILGVIGVVASAAVLATSGSDR